jgi:hypothetical protein
MKNLAIILSAFLISTSVFAAIKDSSPIALGSVTISPNSTVNLSLSSLPKSRYFDVTCDIVNDNFSKQYPIVISFNSTCYNGENCNPGSSITINGKSLSPGTTSQQALLNQLHNNLIVSRVTSGATFSFTSYDDSDSAIVQNCTATYSTN